MQIQSVTFDTYVETHKGHELASIRAWGEACPLEPPYYVEVGCNRGRFLAGTARLMPSVSVIGIELRREWAEIAERRVAREAPGNAAALHADATLALPLLFADGGIARLYMLFPDPWWKKKHSKRRLIQPGLLQLFAAKIPTGGLLIIKTDVEPYYVASREVFEEQTQFRLLEPGDPAWPADEPGWPHTTREAHIVEEGLPVYRLYAVRTAVAAEPHVDERREPERFPKRHDLTTDPDTGGDPG